MTTTDQTAILSPERIATIRRALDVTAAMGVLADQVAPMRDYLLLSAVARDLLAHSDALTSERDDLATRQERTREMLTEIDAAVRDGLPLYPKIMDRVEFVRECVKMQRQIGSGELRAYYPPNSEKAGGR